ITSTRMWAVPDLGGDPPSTAVTVKLTSGCSSLSRGLSSTSSAYLGPWLRKRVCRWKYALALSV
uniref:Uncharacterized protein n=1 Tax=Oryctolagus cuniculus TaxID=9986 RepID=A0A5F9DGZ1_RABIT